MEFGVWTGESETLIKSCERTMVFSPCKGRRNKKSLRNKTKRWRSMSFFHLIFKNLYGGCGKMSFVLFISSKTKGLVFCIEIRRHDVVSSSISNISLLTYFYLFFCVVLSHTMGGSTSPRWVVYSWPRFGW